MLKTTVRLPWELGDAWADYLRGEDEPEDDEAEAFRVNKQRLKVGHLSLLSIPPRQSAD